MARREPAPKPLDEDLVGYLLDVLDEPARRETEAHLNANPEARRKLDLLRRALAPLESTREDAEPPTGIAERTLALILRHQGTKLPTAPTIPVSQAMPRGWWRRPDVLAASILLFLMLGAVIAWVAKSRHEAEILACQKNMQQLYGALMLYTDQHHGVLPRVEAQGPHAFAGIYIPLLVDAGVLTGETSITCPASEKRPPPQEPNQVRKLEEWFGNDRSRFEKALAGLAGSYAYALGYRDGSGLHGLRLGAGMDRAPIMADCPPFHGKLANEDGNSREHGGKGQNVLYLDGSVQFVTTRVVAGDDFYLNENRLILAGVHEGDTVLGSYDAAP